MSDLDEFGFGEDQEAERKPVSPYRNRKPTKRTLEQSELLKPVTMTFLAAVLGMDRATVKRKLAECPAVGSHRGNQPLYDFRQAIQYLVKPRVNIAKYIQKAGTDDLPISLQKDVWDAKLKRQQFEQRAGDLWRTEDIVAVVSEALKRLDTAMRLWSERLEEKRGLTTEQRADLTVYVDELRDDLHRQFKDLTSEQATRSMISEIDEIDDVEAANG